MGAVIPITDLERLVKSIVPLRVTIDEERGPVITFGSPHVELVPGKGLRLSGSAVASWDFAHVPIPVTLNAWQLLFVPLVTSRGGSHVLSFETLLENLDVKSVPGFVDGKIADAVRGAVERYRDRLAWSFSRTLSRRFPLSTKVSPTNSFAICPIGGEVSVDESELHLVLHFEAQFELEAQFDAEEAFEGTAAPEVEPEAEPQPEPEAEAGIEAGTEIASKPVSRGVHFGARSPLGLDARRLPRGHFPTRSRTLRRPAPLRAGRIG